MPPAERLAQFPIGALPSGKPAPAADPASARKGLKHAKHYGRRAG